MLNSLIQSYLSAIKIRALFVFLAIHTGLILAIFGLASLPKPDGMETGHWLLLSGIIGLYGGMVLGGFFIVWPLVNIVRKVRRLMQWREWILEELPKILAMIPTVVEAFRGFSRNSNGHAPSSGPYSAGPTVTPTPTATPAPAPTSAPITE